MNVWRQDITGGLMSGAMSTGSCIQFIYPHDTYSLRTSTEGEQNFLTFLYYLTEIIDQINHS